MRRVSKSVVSISKRTSQRLKIKWKKNFQQFVWSQTPQLSHNSDESIDDSMIQLTENSWTYQIAVQITLYCLPPVSKSHRMNRTMSIVINAVFCIIINRRALRTWEWKEIISNLWFAFGGNGPKPLDTLIGIGNRSKIEAKPTQTSTSQSHWA